MSLAVAFPKWRKPALYFGLGLSVAGLLGASFSTTESEPIDRHDWPAIHAVADQSRPSFLS